MDLFLKYGINASVVGIQGLQATGGTIEDFTIDGVKYRAHIFTESGTFTITKLSPFSELNKIDCLVVGGGGSGGSILTFGAQRAGAGGAGGFIQASLPASLNTYDITVGAGGALQTSYTNGNNGEDSVISLNSNELFKAIGGGGGASGNPAAKIGGSGGAGGTYATAGAAGILGQGFSGSSHADGNAGGGASEPGATDGFGHGGDGIATSIIPNNIGYGHVSDGKVYFAGGGSGGGTSLPGGLGGGGQSSSSNGNGGNALANTGGGGGGCQRQSGTIYGGAGGSGIVIIRYIVPEVEPTDGGYELLYSEVVSTAKTQIDITGLNITKDDEVRLVYTMVGDTSSTTASYRLFVNDDNSISNYYSQLLYGGGTTILAQRPQTTVFSTARSTNKVAGFADIKVSNNDKFVFQTQYVRQIGSESSSLEQYNWNVINTGTVSSITKLSIVSDRTNGIAVGSKIQLFKVN